MQRLFYLIQSEQSICAAEKKGETVLLLQIYKTACEIQKEFWQIISFALSDQCMKQAQGKCCNNFYMSDNKSIF